VVLLTLAASDHNLAVRQVEVLHAQLKAFL
jgi:hypothetical protein